MRRKEQPLDTARRARAAEGADRRPDPARPGAPPAERRRRVAEIDRLLKPRPRRRRRRRGPAVPLRAGRSAVAGLAAGSRRALAPPPVAIALPLAPTGCGGRPRWRQRAGRRAARPAPSPRRRAAERGGDERRRLRRSATPGRWRRATAALADARRRPPTTRARDAEPQRVPDARRARAGRRREARIAAGCRLALRRRRPSRGAARAARDLRPAARGTAAGRRAIPLGATVDGDRQRRRRAARRRPRSAPRWRRRSATARLQARPHGARPRALRGRSALLPPVSGRAASSVVLGTGDDATAEPDRHLRAPATTR